MALVNRQLRAWLAINRGVTFRDEAHLPGIELIMPDPALPRKERKDASAWC